MIPDLGLVKEEHDRKEMMVFHWLEEKLGLFMWMTNDQMS